MSKFQTRGTSDLDKAIAAHNKFALSYRVIVHVLGSKGEITPEGHALARKAYAEARKTALAAEKRVFINPRTGFVGNGWWLHCTETLLTEQDEMAAHLKALLSGITPA